jgi:hypothetical protein
MGIRMKLARLAALAIALALCPLTVRSEDPVWRSAQPTWKASPGERAWTQAWSGYCAPWVADVSAGHEVLPMPRVRRQRPELEVIPTSRPKVTAPAKPEVLLPAELRAPTYTPDYAPEMLLTPAGMLTLPGKMRVEEEEPEGLAVPPRLAPLPRKDLILPPDVRPVPALGPAASILPPGRDCPPAALDLPQRRRLLPSIFNRHGTENPDDDSRHPFLDALLARENRLVVRPELLMWWTRDDRVPALATTGTPASNGVLGQPGTVPLFGPGPLNMSQRTGMRLYTNYWLDEERTWGLDGAIFFLPTRRAHYAAGGLPVLSRPFFSINDNREDAENVAFPGIATGRLGIDASSQFWGSDTNILKRIVSTSRTSIDVFVGYQYLYLGESLSMTEDVTALPGAPVPAGTNVIVQDRFATRDYFHGGQIGTHVQQRWDRFFLDFRGSVAIGATQEILDIGGNQAVTPPGQPTQRFLGGLLTTPSNIGHYGHKRFGVVPQLGFNAGFQVTPHLRAFAGYSLIYWSNVIRPGDQIDRAVDVALVPNLRPGLAPTGLNRPAVLFNQSSFWAQGVNVGVEWVW